MPGWTKLGGEDQAARPVDAYLDLLEHDGGQRAAAECQDLDGRGRLAGPRRETARELPSREVVGLLDELGLTCKTTQLGAIDLQVTPDRIGSAGEALALFDGIDRRESVDDRHALDQWDGTGPQADDPVRQVSRNGLRPPPAKGWRADGHGAGPLLCLVGLRLSVADRGGPPLGHALRLQ